MLPKLASVVKSLILSAMALSLVTPLSHASSLDLSFSKMHQEALRHFKKHFPAAMPTDKGIWLAQGYSNGGGPHIRNESTIAQVFEILWANSPVQIAIGFDMKSRWFIRFADFKKTKNQDKPTLLYRYADTLTGKIKKEATPEQIDQLIKEMSDRFPNADVDKNFPHKFKMILIGRLEPQQWFEIHDFLRNKTEVHELYPAPPGRWIPPYDFLPTQYLGDGQSKAIFRINDSEMLPRHLKALGRSFDEGSTIPEEVRACSTLLD